MVLEFIIIVLLFVLLTPGVYIYLPDDKSLTTSSFIHGIIFAIILLVLQKNVVHTL